MPVHLYSLLREVWLASQALFPPQMPLRGSLCRRHNCPNGGLAKLDEVNWGEGSQRHVV